jgi:hypothetical protein
MTGLVAVRQAAAANRSRPEPPGVAFQHSANTVLMR